MAPRIVIAGSANMDLLKTNPEFRELILHIIGQEIAVSLLEAHCKTSDFEFQGFPIVQFRNPHAASGGFCAVRWADAFLSGANIFRAELNLLEAVTAVSILSLIHI